jgi:hypothetical protein
MENPNPMFTRRHYRLIAKLLAKHPNEELIADFITLFSSDNPRFSPVKFKKAIQP